MPRVACARASSHAVTTWTSGTDHPPRIGRFDGSNFECRAIGRARSHRQRSSRVRILGRALANRPAWGWSRLSRLARLLRAVHAFRCQCDRNSSLRLGPAMRRVQQANHNRPGYNQDRRRGQEYSLPETQLAGESIRHDALDLLLQLSAGDTGRTGRGRRQVELAGLTEHSISVLCWYLIQMIDNEHLNGPLRRIQLQPKLILKGADEGRSWGSHLALHRKLAR